MQMTVLVFYSGCSNILTSIRSDKVTAFIYKCTAMDIVAGYSCGVVLHKASHALQPFYDIFCIPRLSSNNSRFNHQNSLAVTSRDLVAKQGKAWREMAVNFANEVSLSKSAVVLIYCKIFRHATDGFTCSPEEVAFKIQSSSAGFEPAKPGSNDKQYNHQTSEADTARNNKYLNKFSICKICLLFFFLSPKAV
jgi:hypothetical protein